MSESVRDDCEGRRFQDGPVGFRDVRCSVSDLSGGAEVLVVAEDSSIDADVWGGRLETVGDRLAVSRDDGTDLVGLLEGPQEGRQAAVNLRSALDESSVADRLVNDDDRVMSEILDRADVLLTSDALD